jgi:phosphatidylglycerol---prolipoprotein diacylglyceryl transferase
MAFFGVAGETPAPMLQFPAFNKIAFEIGPLKVHWYGVMYLLGFAVGWWLGRRRAARPGSTWKPNDVDDLVFYSMLGGILGGRIGYVLFYGMAFWAEDPWYPLKITEGGMSIHGGLLGGIVALLIFAKTRKRALGDVFDFTVPLPGLGIFFGRIGNFINGELWGKPTTLPWGFQYNGEVLHPSQLYEALLEGLVLFVLIWWFTSKPRPRYAPTGLFLVWYGLVRVLVEFVRLPDEQLGYLAGGWLTRGMLLSMPMILIGAGLLIWAYRRPSPSGNLAAGNPVAQ